MREWVEVTTQAQLDKAIAAGNFPILKGKGTFVLSDSAQVRAYGSAQVTAYDSAQVRAYGSAQVRAYGSAQVRATPAVAVTVHSRSTRIKGGVVIQAPKPKTAKEWCETHGVNVRRGIATLYKALNDDFTSPQGFDYTPDTKPQAPDWDGGVRECGGGLHFSPSPGHALQFLSDAKRFVACPVRVADIVVHPDGSYPQKVKAPGVAGKVYEVTIDGKRVST